MKTVEDLKPGEKGLIIGFNDPELSMKLLDMGCLPGVEIKMKYHAPLGDPVCINVDGYDLSVRRDEAQAIIIE